MQPPSQTLDPAPYIRAIEESGACYASAQSVRLWLPKFAETVGDRPLTTAALIAYRQRLIFDKYAPSSVNRALAVVKAYLKHLRLASYPGLPDSQLIADALKPVRQDHMMPQYLERAEIAKLCACAASSVTPKPVAMFLALGLLTGMRPGEIIRCRPEHHRPSSGLLVYATKTGRQRNIPTVDSPALAMLLSSGGSGPAPYCDGFTTRKWDTLVRGCLNRNLPRKILRSTHSSYLASSGKVGEFEYRSRLGHTIEVADEHYRCLIQGVTGETVEEWLGSPDEIWSVVRKAVS